MENNPVNGFGDNFIRSLLLTLEQTDFDEFMNLSYHVLMQSPASVLKRKDSIDSKVESINGLIKYFEEKEEYERCTNLQKLKTMLFLNTPNDEAE
jgi:hypothetical protein|tara:strand:+ start:226 stop:510 length:285 start_codon:yes stop_codon:yes gene_type:complete